MSCSFAISIKPERCNIAASGGISKHVLLNQSALKLAFKIRSSNNSNYSVNTPYGFLDTNQSAELIITRRAGKPQPDKLVVQFCDAQEGNNDAASHFATEPFKGEVVGETVIKLSAAE